MLLQSADVAGRVFRMLNPAQESIDEMLKLLETDMGKLQGPDNMVATVLKLTHLRVSDLGTRLSVLRTFWEDFYLTVRQID